MSLWVPSWYNTEKRCKAFSCIMGPATGHLLCVAARPCTNNTSCPTPKVLVHELSNGTYVVTTHVSVSLCPSIMLLIIDFTTLICSSSSLCGILSSSFISNVNTLLCFPLIDTMHLYYYLFFGFRFVIWITEVPR